MVPPGPPRGLPGAGRDDFWAAAKIDEGPGASRGHPGVHFGTRPGPVGSQERSKNRPQIYLWGKKRSQEPCFNRFCMKFLAWFCMFHVFSDFPHFCVFFIILPIKQTSWNTVNYSVFERFCISRFSSNEFSRKTKKYRKTSLKWAPGLSRSLLN